MASVARLSLCSDGNVSALFFNLLPNSCSNELQGTRENDISCECRWGKKVRFSVSGGGDDVTGALGLKLFCIFHAKCLFIAALKL